MLECRYKGQCRIEYDTDFDACYPCIGDWGDTCAEYEPMPDVDVLLEIARICEDTGYMYAEVCVESTDDAFSDLLRGMARIEWKTARVIRKALGVEP